MLYALVTIADHTVTRTNDFGDDPPDLRHKGLAWLPVASTPPDLPTPYHRPGPWSDWTVETDADDAPMSATRQRTAIAPTWDDFRAARAAFFTAHDYVIARHQTQLHLPEADRSITDAEWQTICTRLQELRDAPDTLTPAEAFALLDTCRAELATILA